MSILGQIGSGIYQGASSVASNSLVKAGGTIIGCVIGQQALNSMGNWVGQKASTLTGGRLTLSNVIPEAIKAPCRELGDFMLMKVTAPLSDKLTIPKSIERHFPHSDYNPVSHTVIACPLTEEMLFRLPLVGIFSLVDQTDLLTSAVLTVGDMTCTAGTIVKVSSALLSSIAFTYAYERSSGVFPHNPGRALSLLVSGIGYAVIATQLDFSTALLVHAVYNLSSYFL